MIKQPYDPVERFQKWLNANVKDPSPMDDKSRLHEFLDVISSPDTDIMYKDFALKGLGMMAIRYSASPIILCGAIPVIKKQLSSPHPQLIAQSIRTLIFMANHGGQSDLLDEKIHITVRNIVSNKDTSPYIKKMGMKFYFKILDTPLNRNF
jgi:hypothetical protein